MLRQLPNLAFIILSTACVLGCHPCIKQQLYAIDQRIDAVAHDFADYRSSQSEVPNSLDRLVERVDHQGDLITELLLRSNKTRESCSTSGPNVSEPSELLRELLALRDHVDGELRGVQERLATLSNQIATVETNTRPGDVSQPQNIAVTCNVSGNGPTVDVHLPSPSDHVFEGITDPVLLARVRMLEEGYRNALAQMQQKEVGRAPCEPLRKQIEAQRKKLSEWYESVSRTLKDAPSESTVQPQLVALFDGGDEWLTDARRLIDSRGWLFDLIDAIPGGLACRLDELLQRLLQYLGLIVTLVWGWFGGASQRLLKAISAWRKGQEESADDYLIVQNGWPWWLCWSFIALTTLGLLGHACFVNVGWPRSRIFLILLFLGLGVRMIFLRPARRGRSLLWLEDRLVTLERYATEMTTLEDGKVPNSDFTALVKAFERVQKEVTGVINSGITFFHPNAASTEMIAVRSVRVRDRATRWVQRLPRQKTA